MVAYSRTPLYKPRGTGICCKDEQTIGDPDDVMTL